MFRRTSISPRDSARYGFAAPARVSRAIRVAGLFLGIVLVVLTTNALLTAIWGATSGRPDVVGLRSMRIFGCAAAGLGGVLMRWSSWRLLGGGLLSEGALLALSPMAHPLLFFQAVMAAWTLSSTRLTLTVVGAVALSLPPCLLLLAGLRQKLQLRASTVRGSAAWGRGEALRSAKRGFILGRASGGALLRYDGTGHLMTVAATRSGKGVGVVIPNLLDHPGSAVVTDPKGENYFVTARHRKEVLGQTVVALDPFGLTGKGGGLNPLDMIDLESRDYVERATSMARSMVGEPGKNEVHWVNEARALLLTLILFVKTLTPPSDQSLPVLRQILSAPPDALAESVELMLKSTLPPVREGAARLAQKEQKELSGVISTLQARTHIFSSPTLAEPLSATTFNIDDLLHDKLSLYLIVPQEHLNAFAPWLRLMISVCYIRCTRDAHQRPASEHRILFLLDEFANLGRMEDVLEGISLGAGFGVTFWPILQDMTQLKRRYANAWESFLANSDVLQTFAIQDPFTAEQVTKMLGKTTVWERLPRRSTRREGGRLLQDRREIGREMLTTDELRRLHPARMIIVHRPYQPVVADKIKYYKDPYFAPRASPNPYITPSAVP